MLGHDGVCTHQLVLVLLSAVSLPATFFVPQGKNGQKYNVLIDVPYKAFSDAFRESKPAQTGTAMQMVMP
jgi:hypothetical protein